MSVQLTRQQVNEFKSELISLYMARQQDLLQDNGRFFECVDGATDSELEGFINLLFDLNYADLEAVLELSK